MNDMEIQRLDHKHVWHPCSQMKDYETFKPLVVEGALGSFIHLQGGRTVIDAISSWWCKSLGHQHPALKHALFAQANRFEHVLLANTTNENIAHLSQALAQLLPGLHKVFYASDGSCAVEIALKMSVHARYIQNEKARTKFICLENGYHGETLGTLSISDLGIYRTPYAPFLFSPHTISRIPYVTGENDPLWHDASEAWAEIESSLQAYADTTTALVLEPIVQGAGGMQIYSQDFLSRLVAWAKAHNIHVIADEIMTGIGRTGRMLACEHAKVVPDFLCLSKGLTSGWLPLSAVITRDDIYHIFYDDYTSGKAFLHSHTHSGNALAVAVALATLNVMREENLCEHARHILHPVLRDNMLEIAEDTGKLNNIRSLGAIVAADLITDQPRLGYQVYQQALKRGALLRPLGNTIYWLPPLNIEMDTLQQLKNITREAVSAVQF